MVARVFFRILDILCILDIQYFRHFFNCPFTSLQCRRRHVRHGRKVGNLLSRFGIWLVLIEMVDLN
jgi:hypothetical protein